jgi:hypothetical protein
LIKKLEGYGVEKVNMKVGLSRVNLTSDSNVNERKSKG